MGEERAQGGRSVKTVASKRNKGKSRSNAESVSQSIKG